MPNKPIELRQGRWARLDWDRSSRAVIRVTVVMVVAAFALRLVDGLVLGRAEIALLGVVLVAAAAFGLTAAVGAAVAGFLIYHYVIGGAFPVLDLRAPGALPLALFGFTVSIVGLYTDSARRRERLARSLIEDRQPPAARMSMRALARAFDFAKPWAFANVRAPIMLAAQRAFTSLCIAGAGLTAALVLNAAMGLSTCVLAALASVLTIAALMGARLGVVAGVLVNIALVWLLRSVGHSAAPGQLESGFDLALFAALAWGIGTLSDQVREDRLALQTVVDSSREISAETDETASRAILYDKLSKIMRGGAVEIFDEKGELYPAPGAVDAPLAAPPPADDDSRWRTRRLAANGRDVGQVRWRFPGADRTVQIADEIAISLIDLSASAIVRARLSNENAEMLNVARTEQLRIILLDTVSHHFRSPLAGILGSVTSILNLPEKHDSTVQQQLLLIIREQANRLSRYVETFLSLARLESGSLEINPSNVNLDALIHDVWEAYEEIGSARRYLHVEMGQDLIWSDASLLAQIFGNILENAIKYSPEESVVSISAKRDNGQLVIEVSDQGSGVPETSLERMFERFYRSRDAKAPGLGLGLYITRSLVEMLGGKVIARNRTDGWPGLLITVTLPLTTPTK